MRPVIPQELHRRVEAVLDRVRPGLVVDGGNVELLDVAEDGTVRVELQGACATCPAQLGTLRYAIEATLRQEVAEVGAVVALTASDPPLPRATR